MQPWAARCRSRPFRFADRPRRQSAFKKIIPLINLSRYLHCLSNAIIEHDPLRFPFPRSLVSFFFFFYVGFNEADSRPSLKWREFVDEIYVCIYTVRCVKDKSIGCTRNRFKDKICIFTNLILFMRHKNSHYLFMCRRRIIFIYIFVTVYTSCMKYRAGGVSRLGLPS